MSRERLTNRMKMAAESRKDKKTSAKGDSRRELDGFEYDKSKAKVLKDVLHNVNVSLGTLMAAMKQLSMLRGSDVTPDGKIGGRGFIMEFKDVKQGINESVGTLSDITDSIADELKNPGWGLKDSEVKKLKKEQEKAEEIEEEVEEMAETEPEPEEETSEITLDEEIEKESTIGPDDVRDSGALDRYRDLLGSNAKDRVASVLSRQVVANLVLSKEPATEE
jgi:hypothetical protein